MLREPGDPEKLGEFLQKENISVHYFCLILSSKLPQRGQSNRGSMDSCLKTSKRRQPGLLGRSALCARKRELLSTARRISASETSICLVAKKGVAFHNFLESTNHFVTNIAQHRTSNMGMWGRKAASYVVKTYPNRVLRTSRARVVVKPSTTASAYRNMPTHQQSISSNVHSVTIERVSSRNAENGNSYSRQEVVPHSVCYMRIPRNPQGLLLS
ncbi:LOW QUALITY PROTEIN: PHF7 isoform 4 [Pan troglodytes]|uniref:PHF7 isoform 4 n=1 Tax=Pan troglodytes TaxID=9598 RepID=A0A2J8P8D7_PANTR|nr:LOW QUALITY PROTEIN: PHF7 isoform 4 [Pan troglodytes]